MKFFPNDWIIALYVSLISAKPSTGKNFIKNEYYIKHIYYTQMSEGQNERNKVAIEVPKTKYDYEYRVYYTKY